MWLMYLAVVVTLVSGVEYFFKFLRLTEEFQKPLN